MTQIHLPIITGGAAPVFDMLPYLQGDPATLFELTLTDKHGGQHTSRCQTQMGSGVGAWHWYFTKSNGATAEYEEFYADQEYIFRGVDTSMGDGMFYRLFDSPWCPRFWSPGDTFERNPYVDVRRKADCSFIPERSGIHQTWLRFAQHHPYYTCSPKLLFGDVVELHWLLHDPAEQPDQKPAERYWYARGYGLIQWTGEKGHSYVTEVHAQGERPDNVREVIPCLSAD
jgi:hypothetical protein